MLIIKWRNKSTKKTIRVTKWKNNKITTKQEWRKQEYFIKWINYQIKSLIRIKKLINDQNKWVTLCSTKWLTSRAWGISR